MMEVTEKLKPYPAYKPSGAEWIGEIPERWDVKKLKMVLTEKLKYGANESAELDDENLPRYIRITDFDDMGKLRTETFRSLPYDTAKEYLLKNGDVLFARSGATVGKTFQFKNYDGEACFAGYLIKATVDEEIIFSDYLYYYTKSNSYENWKDSIFIQATIQNISADKYSILDLPIPPNSEQQSIIAFLDRKTHQIDTLIEKEQNKIELLKEQRSAVINQAVTKGLDPDVQMKDSGIEWLEEIPEHWEVKPLKYGVRINRQSLAENVNDDYEIQYIDIGNVNQEGLVSLPKRMTFGTSPSRARRVIKKGDTIVSTVRTYLKAIAYINSEDDNLIASTGFSVLTPTNQIHSKYLYYLVSNQKLIDTVSSLSVGVSYPAINSSDLGSIKIWFPNSIDEQQLISTFLDNNMNKIYTSIKKQEQQIQFLQEYRTALISEAVTGKIDLRGQ